MSRASLSSRAHLTARRMAACGSERAWASLSSWARRSRLPAGALALAMPAGGHVEVPGTTAAEGKSCVPCISIFTVYSLSTTLANSPPTSCQTHETLNPKP
jgi:hypothetical protein